MQAKQLTLTDMATRFHSSQSRVQAAEAGREGKSMPVRVRNSRGRQVDVSHDDRLGQAWKQALGRALLRMR